MSDWTELTLDGTRYRVRLNRPALRFNPWASLEAQDWLDGYGWDDVFPVRRSQTLKSLYELLTGEAVAK